MKAFGVKLDPKTKTITRSEIQSREEADEALAFIAHQEDRIAAIEIEERAKIAAAETAMVARTTEPRAWIAAQTKALEAWAKQNRAEIFPEGKKSLELTRGVIGFRIPKGKIKLVLAVENVVERLKAKKLFDCVRIVEEPDLLKLANYSDEQLEAVGLKRTKPKDKFFYELKKTEVKG
jgi:phage host-nuclease inhibitor protein Gam